ncbi:hypothetical protein FRB90_006171, partial [Tulasnella sp. 427]
VLFFIFFGFNQDAVTEYRRVYEWIRVKIFCRPVKPSNESVLPTYSAPPRIARVKLDEYELDNTSISIIDDDKWGGESRYSSRTDDVPLEALPTITAPPKAHSPESPKDRQETGATAV